MSLFLIISVLLLIIVLAGLFYRPPAPYSTVGSFVAAIAALLLFLIAVGVLHI